MAISNRNVLSRQEKERQLAELMNRSRVMQVKKKPSNVKRAGVETRPYKAEGAIQTVKNNKALDYESKARQWDGSGFNVKAVKPSAFIDENSRRQGLNYIINDNYKLANRGKYNQLDYLQDDEIKTVKHLISSSADDYSRAYDYLDSIESVLNERMAAEQTQKASDFAKENNLMGAAMSLVTGMAKPLGYLGALEQYVDNLVSGEDELIDPNSPYFAGNRVSDALAQGVMEEKSGLAKFLIGTGLSMGNQLMTLPMGTASLAFMGLQGAGDAAFDYAQKGIDTGKALLGATGSGAITYGTERMLPNEQLFGLGNDAWDVLAEGALKHIFKSALGEGVEEVEENVLGNIWDTALMGEDSEYNRLKNHLMAQGVTEEDATKQALFQMYIANSAEAFAGGAFSGGVLGGLGSGANYIRASRMGRQFNNLETVEELINTGSDIRAGSLAEMLAVKNREKLDSKGRLSDADVGKQWMANQQAQADMETEQEKINIRLRYRDMVGKDADTDVVDSLQKIFSGGALSNNEAEAIINDESGRKMFSEKTGVPIPENATMAQKRRAVKSFAEQVASGVSEPVIIESRSGEESLPQSPATTAPSSEGAIGKDTRETKPMFPWSSPVQTEESGLKKQIVSDRGVRFGESGRKAFSSAMKGRSGNAMDGAMKEFELYYMAGSAGLGMDSVERRGSLNDGEVYAAYQSGVNDSEFSKKAYEKKTAVKNENAGFNYDGSVNIEAVTADNLDKVGKAMGVKITVVEKLTDSQGNAVNGKYDSRKGEFILSADNENGIEFVALHELVHRLRLQDRKTFYELGKQVMGYMQANNLLTGEVARQAKLYGLGKGDINYYDLLEEVVADFIGGEYDLQTVVGMFTDKPKSFVQKVIELLDDIINSIKKALGMDVPVDRLEEISAALKDAVRASVENNSAKVYNNGRNLKENTNVKRNSEKTDSRLSGTERSSREQSIGRGTAGNRGNAEETAGKDSGEEKGKPKYQYDLAREEEIEETGKEIRKEARKFGYEIIIYSGELVSITDGEEKIIKSKARSLDDGKILIDAKIKGNAKEIAVHEVFHSELKKGNEQATNYLDTLVLNLKNSNSTHKFIDELCKLYNKLNETDKYDYIENPELVHGELSAYFCGFLYGERNEVIEDYNTHFHNADEVRLSCEAFISSMLESRYSYAGSNANTADRENLQKARDVQARMNMSAEDRRWNRPFTGDENTVFRFSMKQPVEETKNLIAVHNLTEEKLANSIGLGGFPSPSIAIVKADTGHSKYGPISLLFNKKTIDPKNKKNKVYGSDAWTPTAPKIEYRVDEKKRNQFDDIIWELTKDFMGGEFRSSSALGGMIDRDSTSMSTEELINRLTYNDAVKAAYIADNNISVEKKVRSKKYDTSGNDYLEFLIKDMGVQRLAELEVAVRTDKFSDKEEADLRWRIERWLLRNAAPDDSKKIAFAEKVARNTNKYRLQEMISNAWRFYEESGGGTEFDKLATLNEIDNIIKEKTADFEKWIGKRLEGIINEPGIYNDKDPYTASGNRRSFAQLHNPVTLENLVKAMNRNVARGAGMFGNGGAYGLLATATPEYKSISSIKADQDRLKILPEEEYNKILQDADAKYSELITDIQKYNDTDSYYSKMNIGDVILEASKTVKNPTDVMNFFLRESDYELDRVLAERVIDLFKDISQIPTGYFEAKPQRAVGFDEVAAAIVPDNMNADVRAQLEQQGVPVIEYKAGDEADRLEKVNSVEDVRFSRKQEEETADDYAGMDVPESPYTFRGVSKHRVEKQAVKIRKEHGTTIRTSWLTAEISDLYNYIQRGADDTSGEFSFDEAYIRARAIAKEVVDNAVVQTDEYGGEYVEVKNLLKGLNVYVPAADRLDFVGYENYGEFRRKTNSKIKQTNKGTPVDIAYSEMSGLYPGLFPEEITHPAEQLMKLVEVYDNLKTFAVNPYEGYENEVIDALATEIFDNYFTTPQQKRTYADQLEVKLQEQIAKTNKLKEKLAQLKAEKEEEIRQLKLLYKKQYSDLKNALKQQEHAAKLQNEILDIAGQFKRWYKGERDAGYLSHPVLDEYIKELGKLKYRSDIRKASARDIFDTLLEFYSENVLGEYYEPLIGEYIEFIAKNKKNNGKPNLQPLSYEELQYANYVVRAIRKLYQEYDTVVIGGKRERARDLARKEYGILDKYGRSDVKMKFFNYLANKVLTESLFDVVETRVVYQTLEGFHEEGVLKMLHDDMTAGVTKSNKLRIEMLRSRDEFLQKHKDYRTRLEKEKISFRGVEMTVGQAVTAYLTMHREEAKATLTSTAVGSGFDFKDKKGRVSHIQAVSDVDVAIAELKQLLSKEDLEFAEIAKGIFNEKARNVKVRADMDILGFSNVSDSKWYIPIRRSTDQIAQAFSDVRRMVRDVASVYNFSFNRETVKHTEKAIEIIDINALLDNHCGKVAMYAGLTQPLQAFDRVLNSNIAVDTEGKKYGQQNLREKLNSMWKSKMIGSVEIGGFENYHKQLMQDVQSRGRGDSSRVVDRVKSNFASAALGANLKEIISQPTGYFMAYQFLSGEAMAKGATMANDYDSMMKYSDYAMVRDYDKGYLLSESLADRVEGLAKKFGEPLDWADKYTMGKLWNACRVEVELKQGLKIGTEENYKAAAELLEKVGRLTQPNYDASEKSGFQRNKNEIISSFSMFSSVQTKQLSRIVESITKYQMYKERAAKEPIEENKNALAAAKEEMARCQAGILMMNVGYVLICSLVKAALPKKEEEKITDAMDLTKKMCDGLIESYVGMIPLADDAANMFIDGYDAGHFFYSSINDMKDALKGMKNFEKDPQKATWNLIIATGQLTGLPARNISNVMKGAINRGASAMGAQAEYEGNKLLYKVFGGEKKTTYINLLYNALYDGDSDTAKYIIDDMVKRGYTKQSISTSLKTLFAQQAVEYWAEGDSENLQKVFEAMSLVGLSQKNITSQIQTQMKKRIVNDKAIAKLAREISRFRHSDADWQASHRVNLQAKLDKLIQEYAEKGYSQSVVTAAIESLLE